MSTSEIEGLKAELATAKAKGMQRYTETLRANRRAEVAEMATARIRAELDSEVLQSGRFFLRLKAQNEKLQCEVQQANAAVVKADKAREESREAASKMLLDQGEALKHKHDHTMRYLHDSYNRMVAENAKKDMEKAALDRKVKKLVETVENYGQAQVLKETEIIQLKQKVEYMERVLQAQATARNTVAAKHPTQAFKSPVPGSKRQRTDEDTGFDSTVAQASAAQQTSRTVATASPIRVNRAPQPHAAGPVQKLTEAGRLVGLQSSHSSVSAGLPNGGNPVRQRQGEHGMQVPNGPHQAPQMAAQSPSLSMPSLQQRGSPMSSRQVQQMLAQSPQQRGSPMSQQAAQQMIPHSPSLSTATLQQRGSPMSSRQVQQMVSQSSTLNTPSLQQHSSPLSSTGMGAASHQAAQQMSPHPPYLNTSSLQQNGSQTLSTGMAASHQGQQMVVHSPSLATSSLDHHGSPMSSTSMGVTRQGQQMAAYSPSLGTSGLQHHGSPMSSTNMGATRQTQQATAQFPYLATDGPQHHNSPMFSTNMGNLHQGQQMGAQSPFLGTTGLQNHGSPMSSATMGNYHPSGYNTNASHFSAQGENMGAVATTELQSQQQGRGTIDEPYDLEGSSPSNSELSRPSPLFENADLYEYPLDAAQQAAHFLGMEQNAAFGRNNYNMDGAGSSASPQQHVHSDPQGARHDSVMVPPDMSQASRANTPACTQHPGPDSQGSSQTPIVQALSSARKAPVSYTPGPVQAHAQTPTPTQAPTAPAPNPAPKPLPTPRFAACTHCHLNWWNASCDGAEPCANCVASGSANCERPPCRDFGGDACKRRYTSCFRAHEESGFGNIAEFKKDLKRRGKKGDAKAAPMDGRGGGGGSQTGGVAGGVGVDADGDADMGDE
ncbi:hypothetical protein BDV95DRAFT_623759 [Massariosphaeria phaeospora]|uniref:C3H1-type domain-containing protein n=1 Tax=Massariosphaeria phaeospora TaxID=100035 RepID=A0A7C8M2C0_9PLEO|nr:hypothetical protein BDV95DRAFT_623759 [Massariosphaeria phaeospora]